MHACGECISTCPAYKCVRVCACVCVCVEQHTPTGVCFLGRRSTRNSSNTPSSSSVNPGTIHGESHRECTGDVASSPIECVWSPPSLDVHTCACMCAFSYIYMHGYRQIHGGRVHWRNTRVERRGEEGAKRDMGKNRNTEDMREGSGGERGAHNREPCHRRPAKRSSISRFLLDHEWSYTRL